MVYRTEKNRQNPFVRFDCETLNQESLTFGARGLFAYLLGRPANWVLNIHHLSTVTLDSKYIVRKYIKELIDSGHIIRTKIYKEGKLIWNYDLYENPNKLNSSAEAKTGDDERYKDVPNRDVSISNTNNNRNIITIDNNNNTRARLIFEHWAKVMNHSTAKFDDNRKRQIEKAMKLGFTDDQIKMAITGCSLTPHNIGVNDRNQRYDGLHLILRNADQIERFIANATSPPKMPRDKIVNDMHRKMLDKERLERQEKAEIEKKERNIADEANSMEDWKKNMRALGKDPDQFLSDHKKAMK